MCGSLRTATPAKSGLQRQAVHSFEASGPWRDPARGRLSSPATRPSACFSVLHTERTSLQPPQHVHTLTDIADLTLCPNFPWITTSEHSQSAYRCRNAHRRWIPAGEKGAAILVPRSDRLQDQFLTHLRSTGPLRRGERIHK